MSDEESWLGKSESESRALRLTGESFDFVVFAADDLVGLFCCCCFAACVSLLLLSSIEQSMSSSSCLADDFAFAALLVGDGLTIDAIGSFIAAVETSGATDASAVAECLFAEAAAAVVVLAGFAFVSDVASTLDFAAVVALFDALASAALLDFGFGFACGALFAFVCGSPTT